MKAVQATEALGFEAIDGPPDVDHVLAQCVGGEGVDGLVDQRIDGLVQTVSHRRYGERFHTQYCIKHLFVHSTDNVCPRQVLATCGNNPERRELRAARSYRMLRPALRMTPEANAEITAAN